MAWGSCGSFGVWGLHFRFKYDQFWNLHWKYQLITWTCSTGFFYIQETGSWTSVDSAQQQILHGVIWDNFCCKWYNCLLLFCRVWHIFTKKAWCTGTLRYYTKENKLYPQSWLKGCGTPFFPLFLYGICCYLALQTHKRSLNSYQLLCPAMGRTHRSHSESLIPLHTNLSSEYLSFFSATIII